MSKSGDSYERSVLQNDDNARAEESGRVLAKIGAIDPQSVQCLIALIIGKPGEDGKSDVTFSLLGTPEDTMNMVQTLLGILSERPGSRIIVQQGDDIDASTHFASTNESTWSKH